MDFLHKITKSKELERWIDTLEYFLTSKGEASSKIGQAFSEAVSLWRKTGRVKELHHFCYDVRPWKDMNIKTNDADLLFLVETLRNFLDRYWTGSKIYEIRGNVKKMKQGTRKSKAKIKAARQKLEAFKASTAYSQFLAEIGKIKAELEALEGVKNEKNKN